MAAGIPGQALPASMAAPVATGAVPPAINTEWAVPQPTRAKYSATFYQTDRARTGFLAGNQVFLFIQCLNTCIINYVTIRMFYFMYTSIIYI